MSLKTKQTNERLQEIIQKIHDWRGDDNEDYDTACHLLNEIQDELTTIVNQK